MDVVCNADSQDLTLEISNQVWSEVKNYVFLDSFKKGSSLSCTVFNTHAGLFWWKISKDCPLKNNSVYVSWFLNCWDGNKSFGLPLTMFSQWTRGGCETGKSEEAYWGRWGIVVKNRFLKPDTLSSHFSSATH